MNAKLSVKPAIKSQAIFFLYSSQLHLFEKSLVGAGVESMFSELCVFARRLFEKTKLLLA